MLLLLLLLFCAKTLTQRILLREDGRQHSFILLRALLCAVSGLRASPSLPYVRPPQQQHKRNERKEGECFLWREFLVFLSFSCSKQQAAHTQPAQQ